MAYSYEDFTGDGAKTDFAVNKPYINATHITLLVDGVSAAFTWVNAALIRASAAPALDAEVRVLRTTPALTVLVDYYDGSTLGETDLDLSALQALYVAQEAFDAADERLGHVTGSADWDAAAARVTDVADPTSAQDAATKAYVDEVAAGAGNVPTPDDPVDDGAVLVASGGTFAWDDTKRAVAKSTQNNQLLIGDGAGGWTTVIPSQGLQASGSNTVRLDSGYLPQFIAGLQMAPSVSTPLDDITVAGGMAVSTSGQFLRNASARTKGIKGAFVAGTGQDGLDVGTSPSTSAIYAVWVIGDGSNGLNNLDVLFSLSFTAPTMPSGFTTKRLIGAILTDGSGDIISFVQSGDYFELVGSLPTELNDSSITSDTYETAAIRVPPNCMAHLKVTVTNPTNTDTAIVLYLKRAGGPDVVSTLQDSSAYIDMDGAVSIDTLVTDQNVMTDASRQISYATFEGTGAATISMKLRGFTMLTRNYY